ncbi:MAG: glycosyl transferase family 28 [Planctomycetes bacterium]|nr:glycosyl transferase family 28 [Planctomycetota bacterium]
MIFLTVGTQFPFDRLVRSVDEAIGANGHGEKMFAQIGNSSYRTRNFDATASLEKKVFDRYISESSCIISHAGMGTITIALENNKRLLVMPRLKKYGEVVNDHQVAIARKFEQLGYLLVAYTEEEIPDKLEQLKSFVPKKRENQADLVVARLVRFLGNIE